MSLQITTNRADLDKRNENEFLQVRDQVTKKEAADKSRFILMQANQQSTMARLGFAGDELHDVDRTTMSDCDMERDCPIDMTP